MAHLHHTTADSMIETMPPGALALLRTVAVLAAPVGARVALVGGVVRDLALGLPLDRDLDLVVEGDVPTLARQLAAATGGRVAASYDAFGTATVELPAANGTGGIALVDLAGARAEVYAAPGALPTVRPATLEEDLLRRDFAVNAVALEIDCPALAAGAPPKAVAALRDPFGGLDDLRAGLLRVLHPQSFRDDPTRILRGLRLAARLALRFDEATRELLEAEVAAGGLGQISADRVRGELCLALEEPRPEAALRLADSLGVTPHLAPSLQFTPALAARMDAARQEAPFPPEVMPHLLTLGLLAYDLAAAEREGLIRRYRLPGDAARLLRELSAARGLRATLATPALPPSSLDQLLQPFSDTPLHALRLAEAGSVAEAVGYYLRHLRPTATLLNGHDLLALGVPPGRQVGALLTELRAAQLDGALRTREKARIWVQERTTNHGR